MLVAVKEQGTVEIKKNTLAFIYHSRTLLYLNFYHSLVNIRITTNKELQQCQFCRDGLTGCILLLLNLVKLIPLLTHQLYKHHRRHFPQLLEGQSSRRTKKASAGVIFK